MKVFVQREQAIRLQFPKNAPKLLLNPLDCVEERAPVDAELPGA